MKMTWKEFKDIIENQGVEDDTEISYIDISEGYPDIVVEWDYDNNKICVT
jgi:hypothetical protein